MTRYFDIRTGLEDLRHIQRRTIHDLLKVVEDEQEGFVLESAEELGKIGRRRQAKGRDEAGDGGDEEIRIGESLPNPQTKLHLGNHPAPHSRSGCSRRVLPMPGGPMIVTRWMLFLEQRSRLRQGRVCGRSVEVSSAGRLFGIGFCFYTDRNFLREHAARKLKKELFLFLWDLQRTAQAVQPVDGTVCARPLRSCGWRLLNNRRVCPARTGSGRVVYGGIRTHVPKWRGVKRHLFCNGFCHGQRDPFENDEQYDFNCNLFGRKQTCSK